ncbi:glutaminyl-peptide cyclotransferase [Thermodesulfobacteriota bacterium]
MKYHFKTVFLELLVTALFFSGCCTIKASDDIIRYSYKVAGAYPHDPDAQTEGLIFMEGFLYEGTGPGRSTSSSLRKVDLKSGDVLSILMLPEPIFGEGITIHDNKIIQLTYKSNTGFVYERESFELLQQFEYPTQGWGLTHDGKRLIMSDGTAILYYLDPVTYQEIKRLRVYDKHGPVSKLNELEFIKGEIYANVFETSNIVRISPQTGHVIGYIDLSLLLKDHFHNTESISHANGIAHDPINDRLFVTGKYWPELFEVEMISQDRD